MDNVNTQSTLSELMEALNAMKETLHTLRKENEELKEQKKRLETNKSTTNGLKVSTAGAVSLYGLQRFPVTLYANQWNTLLSKADEIRSFIADNESLLKVK